MRKLCAVLGLVVLAACSPEAGDGTTVADQTRSLAANEGFAVEGQIADFAGFEGLCLLYVLNEQGWTALAVERNFDDGPPFCGAVEPYLDRIDIIVGWNPADLTPIADLGLVQNLAETYDQPTGRNVDYFYLNGRLSADFWGTVYGPIEQAAISTLGDTCALYLENDDGEPYGLLEPEDASGACPILDAIPNFATIRTPLDELIEVVDPATIAELDATFFGSAQAKYVFLSTAPAQL